MLPLLVVDRQVGIVLLFVVIEVVLDLQNTYLVFAVIFDFAKIIQTHLLITFTFSQKDAPAPSTPPVPTSPP